MNLTKAQKFKLKAVGLGDLIEKIEAVEEKTIVSMTLNTEDGGTIEVEREEGEPQVGDTASPDGEHLMSDGTTIVITDGVITEIRPAEEQTTEEAMTEEEMSATIASMTEIIETLTAENEDLKKKLESSKANEKTAEDIEILQLVSNAGGLKWLRGLKTSYKPEGRKNETTEEKSELRKRLDEKRKALEN